MSRYARSNFSGGGVLGIYGAETPKILNRTYKKLTSSQYVHAASVSHFGFTHAHRLSWHLAPANHHCETLQAGVKPPVWYTTYMSAIAVHAGTAGDSASLRRNADLVASLRDDHPSRGWASRGVVPRTSLASKVARHVCLRRDTLVRLGLSRKFHTCAIQQLTRQVHQVCLYTVTCALKAATVNRL